MNIWGRMCKIGMNIWGRMCKTGMNIWGRNEIKKLSKYLSQQENPGFGKNLFLMVFLLNGFLPL